MNNEQIEVLIDAIYAYNYDAPYIILLYIPSNEDYIPDFYFAVLAALREPDDDELDNILRMTKRQVGNMIFAADTKIMLRDDALDYLEDLLD